MVYYFVRMSYTHLLYHLVFSTKDRQPVIASAWESRLHAYLGGIVRDLNGQSVAINGMPDHVHLLFFLHQSASVANTVKHLKSRSSHWVNQGRLTSTRFGWQTKYGAFAVSRSQMEFVVQYIRGQKEHHRKMTFQEEFERMLERHGLEYDPKYYLE